jgi:hypothetical protein
MPHTLAQLWKDKPAFLDGKSFRQIIQLAGDGRLRDGNDASTELREWLSAIPLERLRLCAEDCLSDSFDDSGHALQDAVNEVGVRLGFEVTPGRYRGMKNAVGNDGLWVGEDGFGLLVEVKTTDTYRVNLDTVAEYRRKLIAEGKINAENSSILIAVGRQDTGDLEAQIRGSQHAWAVRLISVDALLRLAEVKEQLNDWSTSNKINQLLRPVEYTRLDGIVELLFATKQDLDTPEVNPPSSPEHKALEPAKVATGELETAREAVICRIEAKLGAAFVRRGKALRASSDGRTRLVCLASQKYEGPGGSANYWYVFTLAQREFIRDAEAGYLALVCGVAGKAFLVPREEFFRWLPDLLTTPPVPASPDEIRHWHVYFNDYGQRVDLMRSGGGTLADLGKFLLPEQVKT